MPFAIGTLLYALLVGFQPTPASQSTLDVTFLDVGQGDAVLIRAPGGRTAVVDAGRSDPTGALRSRGVREIDLLVASHPHADHIGGMRGLIDNFPVRFYLDNGVPHTTATYRRLMQTLEASDITYLSADPRTIALGPASIQILPRPPSDGNLNNQSVAMIVRHGRFSAFLSGDSETEQLEYMVRRGLVVDVTLLKAPHHGSANGVTPDFLRLARPEVVAISVGRGNGYGHPHRRALDALSAVIGCFGPSWDSLISSARRCRRCAAG